MLLTVLKHGGTWSFLATLLDIQASTFERTVTKFVDVIPDEVIIKLKDPVRAKYSMKNFF